MAGRFRRWWRRVEQRVIDSVPWSVGAASPQAVTQERALRLAPVYAAHRFLADQISTLPLKPHRQVGETRQPMSSLPQLFQFMVEDGTLVDWLTRAVMSLASQGNAIGLITSRDGFGFPTGVRWRPRSEFFVDDTSNLARPQWYWLGRKVDRSELVHIPWLTVPGQTLGLSPIEAFAATVGIGLSAQQYASDWFEAGGVPPGTFKNAAKVLKPDEAEIISDRLVGAIRKRRPLVYGNDWDFNAIAISPQQAEFVQSMKLSANQIAAIYGIAPDEIGGEAANSLTYSTEEMRQIKRMADCRPWIERLENGFAAILPERQYVRLHVDAAIRGDLLTRYRGYEIARRIGLQNVDEQRATEFMPPLPNGQGQDYTPLLWTDQPGERDSLAAAPGPAGLNGQSRRDLIWVSPH